MVFGEKSMERADLGEIDSSDLDGPKIDRRTTVKLLGAAGVGGLAGCTDDDTGDTTEDAGDADEPGEREGGRLQVAWWADSMDELDPAFIGVGIQYQLMGNIMSGLVTVNEDLEFVGDLAEDWEVAEDGEQFTFNLRDDVEFHNGEHFTAEDVEYSIRRNIELEAPHNLSTRLRSLDDGGVEIIDDYTVELNWVEPSSPAFTWLVGASGRAATIVNETAFEEMGRDEYGRAPVGTGPFEVVEHDPGSQIVLDAHENYHRTDEDGNSLPYVDGVDISFIPEEGTLINSLQSGDIHMSNLLPLENVSELEGANDVNISQVLGNTWTGVFFNYDDERFQSIDARRGIAKAIDNEAFVNEAYFGHAFANTGVFSQLPEWAWREPEDKPDHQQYDPEEAQELLEESGLTGETISFLAYDENLRAGRVLRTQLAEFDVEVEIDQVTTSAFWESMSSGDFEVSITGSVDKPDPEESVWNFYRLPEEGGVWNYGDYVNEEAHSLLSQQRDQFDVSQRAETLHELEDVLIEDCANAYIGHLRDMCAVREEVNGFAHIPSFLRPFETVWLSE